MTRKGTPTFHLIITLLLLGGLLLSWRQAWATAHVPPHVLILNSYHPGMPFSDSEIQGVRSILESRAELHIEYLDAKNIPVSGRYEELLFEILRLKHATSPPQAIVSLDDDALRFLFRHRDRLFADVPIVFGGVNDYDKKLIASGEKITGVVEEDDVAESLRWALRLRPQTRTIYAITDSTTNGRVNHATLERLQSERALGVPIVFLNPRNDLTLTALLAKVKGLPLDSIVYHSDFFVDGNGSPVSPEELIPSLSRASPVPIFVHAAMYVPLGAVGGKVVDGFSHGAEVARLALEILEGRPHPIPPLRHQSTSIFLYNALELDRWNIPRELLPSHARLVNAPDPMQAKYRTLQRWTWWGATAFALVLALAFGYLLARRRGEKQIQANEIRLRTLLEHAPAAVYLKDRNGRYVGFNSTAAKLFGWTEREVIGKTDDELFSAPLAGIIRDNESQVWQGRGAILFEETLPTQAGPRTFLSSRFCIPDREGPRLCTIAMDISRLKETEAELIRAKNRAEVANEARSLFLANVSHEIRTPLNTILGYAQLLPLEHDVVRREEYVAHMERAGQHLLLVIDDILSMARMEAGAFEKQRTGFSLERLLEETIALVKDRVQVEKVALLHEVVSPLAETYWGDPAKIRQILLNLLSNAIKFTQQGSIRLACRVVEVHPSHHVVELSVQDSGKGIEPRFLEDLFKPFRQEDDSSTRRHGGTGLGLSIVHRLVKAMQGSIQVESVPGMGSLFTVTLPLGLFHEEISSENRASEKGTSPRMPSLCNQDVCLSHPGSP